MPKGNVFLNSRKSFDDFPAIQNLIKCDYNLSMKGKFDFPHLRDNLD